MLHKYPVSRIPYPVSRIPPPLLSYPQLRYTIYSCNESWRRRRVLAFASLRAKVKYMNEYLRQDYGGCGMRLGPGSIPTLHPPSRTVPHSLTESNISLFPPSVLLHQQPLRQPPTTHPPRTGDSLQAILAAHELPSTQFFRAIYFAITSSRIHIIPPIPPSPSPADFRLQEASLHSCGAFIPTIQFSWGSLQSTDSIIGSSNTILIYRFSHSRCLGPRLSQPVPRRRDQA